MPEETSTTTAKKPINWKYITTASLFGFVLLVVGSWGLLALGLVETDGFSSGRNIISTQKDEIAGWKTYTSNKFTLKYPKDFTVKQYPDDNQIYFYSPDYDESQTRCQVASDHFENITYMNRGGMVKVGVDNYAPYLLDKNLNELANEIISGPNSKQLADTKIDSKRAVVFETNYIELNKKYDRCGDPLVVQKQFVTENKEGNKFDIDIYYSSTILKNTLESIISTFKFLE